MASMTFFSIFYKHKEGGFNKRLYRVYNAIAERGHRIHYISCEPFPVKHPNIYFHNLNMPFKKSENIIFWLIFLFLAPIYSLCICWKSWYSTFCSLPRILLKQDIILFLRADSVELDKIEKKSLLKKFLNYILEYIGVTTASKIFTNIGLVRKKVIERYKIPESKIGLIYNNIDNIHSIADSDRLSIRAKLGIPYDAFALATSGVFYRRKNIDFLLYAFSKVKVDAKVMLIIIGDDISQGTEKKKLHDLVKSLNISNAVLFTGWRNDSVDIIASCDLFVLPTLHEGFPNSLLDAFSAGVPCIGSRIDEIKEVLYYDDLLFDVNDVTELTFKISNAVNRSEYFHHISRLSLERAHKFCFDWDENILEIITS